MVWAPDPRLTILIVFSEREVIAALDSANIKVPIGVVYVDQNVFADAITILASSGYSRGSTPS